MLDAAGKLLSIIMVIIAIPYLNLSIQTAIRVRREPIPPGASRIRPADWDVLFAFEMLMLGCSDLQDWIAWGSSLVVAGGVWLVFEVIATIRSLWA